MAIPHSASPLLSADEPDSILVLEDDANHLAMLKTILTHAGHRVVGVQRGRDAIDALVGGSFAAAVLDIHLPDMTGLEVLRALREHDVNVPTIMLSGDSSIESAITALRLAAFDFVRKPAEPDKLVALVGRAIDEHHARDRLGWQGATPEQIADIRRWEHQALHDCLTGLPNRKLLLDRLTQGLAAARRSGHSLAVLFFDVDRFKGVNEQYGHAVGDRVLQGVAARLAAAMRASDTIARLGGDEFVAVLSDIDLGGISVVVEKLHALFDKPLMIGALPIHVQCSIGCAVYPPEGASPEELLDRADRAMFTNKHALSSA